MTAETRQKLGLSQSGFARLMGDTSPFTIAKWEQGHRKPTRQAGELMRLLVWLHEEYPQIYVEWMAAR